MTDLTSKELVDQINTYREKPLKYGSYPRAKLIEMLNTFKEKAAEAAPQATEAAKAPADSTDTFTLSQLAQALGIPAKTARARYRAHDNDHVYSKYIFKNTKEEIERVTSWISKA